MKNYYQGSLNAVSIREIKVYNGVKSVMTAKYVLSTNTIFYSTNLGPITRFEDDRVLTDIETATEDIVKYAEEGKAEEGSLFLCYDPTTLRGLPLSRKEETALENVKKLTKKREKQK